MLLVRDDVEAASGVEPEALIEEARQHQRQRMRRRKITLGIAAAVAILAFGINGLVQRGGGGVQAASPSSTPPQSRSSGLLAFSRVGGGGESHVMVVDPSGRDRPRDLGPGMAPSWSPDGKRLVFIDAIRRGVHRLGRIFVMNADGSGRHPLPLPSLGSSRVDVDDSAPTWSPKGDKIAFTRMARGRSAIYVVDLVQGGLRRVTAVSEGELPAFATWSPDGRRLAYVGDIAESFSDGRGSHGCTGLHVTNVDGTQDRLLAAASRLPDGCVVVWTPAWSPDGRWIAFAHPIEHFGGGMDLYVISPDGTHLRRLTHRPNLINSSPTWSADGDRIAFAFGGRDRGGPGPGGPDQIRAVVVIDRDGSHRHTILRVRADMHLGGPAWQPR